MTSHFKAAVQRQPQVRTMLEWRRLAANRKVHRMAASIPNTAPVVHFTPSRSRYQYIYCLVNRGTCVWTTCPELHLAAEQPGIELVTSRSRIQRPTTTPPSHEDGRWLRREEPFPNHWSWFFKRTTETKFSPNVLSKMAFLNQNNWFSQKFRPIFSFSPKSGQPTKGV